MMLMTHICFLLLQWSDWIGLYDQAPPIPTFNKEDDQDCRDTVNWYYESAMVKYEFVQTRIRTLKASYDDILERQTKYGMELSNNAAFKDWSISDWEDSDVY